MKIKAKHFLDWQRRCIDIQRASEAVSNNRDSIHHQNYVCAHRYAVRRCGIAERRMTGVLFGE